jgi:hypothetical protein
MWREIDCNEQCRIGVYWYVHDANSTAGVVISCWRYQIIFFLDLVL